MIWGRVVLLLVGVLGVTHAQNGTSSASIDSFSGDVSTDSSVEGKNGGGDDGNRGNGGQKTCPSQKPCSCPPKHTVTETCYVTVTATQTSKLK